MASPNGNPSSRSKPRSLRVGFFNLNGIKGQRAELLQFVRDHNLDVLLLQETFLKPAHRSPNLAHFKLVRNDRTSGPLGGTLIYYKRSLHCIPLDPPDNLRNIEVSVCRLSMTGHPAITLISAYLSPTKELHSNDIRTLLSMGESVLLAGDLNAKNTLWGCNLTNSRGAALESCLEDIDMCILAPSEPTHYPDQDDSYRPDILDIALVRNVCLRVRSLQVVQELNSDHRPVLIELVPQTDPPGTGPNASNGPMTVKTNWRLLGTKLADTSSPDLDAIPSNIVSREETTGAIRSFTDHLQHALSESSERVPAAVHDHWRLPEDVREVVRRRNAALKACASRPVPERRRLARFLQREAKRRIQGAVDSGWERRLSEIKPTHTAFWQLVRSFKRRDVVSMPPLDRPNQRPAFDDDEKAELLASSLESQCSLTDTPVENDIVVAVDTYVESRNATPPPLPTPRPLNINPIVAVGPDVDSPPLDPLAPVTTEEVIILIKALKRRKAPGADGIPNRLLKMLPEHLVKILAAIFNAAFQKCIFPEAWKEAVVIGIHKPGKPASSPTSYRPISLLSSLGKLYERIVHNRLKIVAHLHNLLPPEQFGFRSRHNCVHQVLRITEHVYNKRRYNRPTGAIFFDVEKAFDKVWHNGLLFKLYTLNVPTQLVHIIRDFLSNRGFKYRVEGTLSSRHTISAGVPQGSALSPFLFSLYTSDIPSFEDAHLALFADDTAIYASHRNPDKLVHILQSAADLSVRGVADGASP
ncbi:hypothetical protein O3G_MSEX011283 [Manduca sexta]|uniref:Reverse transcriptase domain-containing protein n=1 Tax=Manduca sexta TaxID=7130 RepID=A0A921ZKX9_MANSE|nr:hypothetical protein O3G_MSEX011283 [Manduca sexta]